MNPPAFLLSAATSQLTKPNTRIPPILAAGKTSNLNSATSTTTTTAEPPFSRVAALSKQKLSAEVASGDPDLRRCLGHHRLLTRSLYEAKEDMKRYLEEVLESESEDDEDLYGEYEFGKGEVLFQEDDAADNEDGDDHQYGDECPIVEETGVVAAATATRTQTGEVPAPVQAPAPRRVPCSNSTPPSTSTPGPVWMKEKVVGAVRGLVRRRNSASLHPSPGGCPPEPPPPPPSTTCPPATPSEKQPQSTLAHMDAKSASCSQIPVYIHIHEHLSGSAGTLERSHSQSQLQSQAQRQGRSITMRGRQYAQRLGLKVAAAVPVTS